MLTDLGVAPASNGDGTEPAYELPHITFQLANHEVRELLMNEQLYGDPQLALRELYQNALDACRYREARIKFLTKRGVDVPDKLKITFRQGIDEKGARVHRVRRHRVGDGQARAGGVLRPCREAVRDAAGGDRGASAVGGMRESRFIRTVSSGSVCSATSCWRTRSRSKRGE